MNGGRVRSALGARKIVGNVYPKDTDLSDGDRMRPGAIRSLMAAVLENAVEDLNWKEDPKTCWRQMKMDAAKWLLGVGRENGQGIALTDVTELLGVDAQKVAKALGAEKKLREWSDSKRRGKRVELIDEGDDWSGDGDGVGDSWADFDERVVYLYE